MKISLEQVEKVAELARISLSEDEKSRFANDLSQILDYVEKINELDTSQVEPTAHILDLKNVTRNDSVRESMAVEDIVNQAPKKKDNFIVVPKVI